MNIDINLLKQLRELTNAPLKDCKEVLVEANGDLTQAQELLKQKGAIKAVSKADREIKEGIVKIQSISGKTVWVRLGCETDFVAKNDKFISIAQQMVERLSQENDFSGVDQIPQDTMTELDTMMKDNFVAIGENMKICDAFVKSGQSYIYVYSGDKIGTAIFYETLWDGAEEAVKELALQIIAMNPEYLDMDSISWDIKDQLQTEFTAEMQNSGKPANIIDSIVAGKIQKELGSVTLMEQPFFKDESKKVKDIVANKAKVTSFVRIGF